MTTFLDWIKNILDSINWKFAGAFLFLILAIVGLALILSTALMFKNALCLALIIPWALIILYAIYKVDTIDMN